MGKKRKDVIAEPQDSQLQNELRPSSRQGSSQDSRRNSLDAGSRQETRRNSSVQGEKVDELKLARDTLKKRQQERSDSPSEKVSQPEPKPEKESGIICSRCSNDVKSSGEMESREKVLLQLKEMGDIDLVLDLLKKMKDERRESHTLEEGGPPLIP